MAREKEGYRDNLELITMSLFLMLCSISLKMIQLSSVEKSLNVLCRII